MANICDTYFKNIRRLSLKVIEPRSQYNYIKICVNVLYIVRDHYDEIGVLPPREHRINLAVCILDDVVQLRPLKHLHISVIEQLLQLVDNGRLDELQDNTINCCNIL